MIIFLDKKNIKIEKHRTFVRVTHLVFITYKMINFLVTFQRFSLPLGEIYIKSSIRIPNLSGI